MSLAPAVPRQTDPIRPVPEGPTKVGGRTATFYWIAQHSIAIALGFMFLVPIVFLVLTSFMDSNQTLTSELWPRGWHPENYVEVFSRTPMPRYLLNTVIYAAGATAFMLLSSIPAAYALSKLQWRGRNV